jgi:hypothetical protein
MLDAEATSAERLQQAQYVVATIKAFEERLLPPVDESNETADEELFETERHISAFPDGARRQKLQSWLKAAKSEYLQGRIATNIVRNWFEFESFNAQAVIDHQGDIDFKIDANEFATKAAEIAILREIKVERDKYKGVRDALQQTLLGVLA